MATAYGTHVPVFPPFTGVGSYAFKSNLIDKLPSERIAECPIERATTYYVDVSTTLGDSSGGTGTGTAANPWLVDTIASLNTLITAHAADGVAWKLTSGDILRPDPANPNIQGLPAANSMSYSVFNGTSPFKISGFVKENTAKAGVWTAGANSSYSKVFTNRAVFWVRYDEDPEVRLLLGTERVFKSRAAATDISGSAADGIDSFNITTAAGTSTVTVRLSGGTSPAGVIELAMVAAKYGIDATASGVRLDRLCFLGFGLDDRNGAFQNVNTQVGTTKNFVATNCSSLYTAKHAFTQTNNSTAGGFATFDNCIGGLVSRPTSANKFQPTGLVVFYSNDGAHEGLCTNFSALYGGLPEAGVDNTASDPYADRYGVFPCYMHTGHNDGSTLCSLMVFYNIAIADGPWSCDANSTFADPGCPLMTNSVAFSTCRAFVVNEVYNGSRTFYLSMTLMNFAQVNCWYAGKQPAAFATTSTLYASPSSAGYVGGGVNCIYDMDWTPCAAAGPPYKWCNRYVPANSGNSDMFYANCHFSNRSAADKQIQFQPGGNDHGGVVDMLNWNGRVSNCMWTTDVSSATPDPVNIARNQDFGVQTSYALPLANSAAVPTGGIRGIRVYRAITVGVANAGSLSGVNSAAGYALLAANPVPGAAPVAAIKGTGSASFLTPEYDRNWHRVNTAAPSFGPVGVPSGGHNQQSPLAIAMLVGSSPLLV